MCRNALLPGFARIQDWSLQFLLNQILLSITASLCKALGVTRFETNVASCLQETNLGISGKHKANGPADPSVVRSWSSRSVFGGQTESQCEPWHKYRSPYKRGDIGAGPARATLTETGTASEASPSINLSPGIAGSPPSFASRTSGPQAGDASNAKDLLRNQDFESDLARRRLQLETIWTQNSQQQQEQPDVSVATASLGDEDRVVVYPDPHRRWLSTDSQSGQNESQIQSLRENFASESTTADAEKVNYFKLLLCLPCRLY